MKDETLTVLLVEDDALIRMNTADMIEDLGHVVVEAGDGAQAITELQARRPDILVTDIGLPDISGSEVAIRAREIDPDIAVVFATGDSYLPEGAVKDAVLLSKPYDNEALQQALKKAASER